MGITTTGTLGRKSRRAGATSSPGPPCHLTERLKHKRHNVDSGYSTSDDKRWSQEGNLGIKILRKIFIGLINR